MNRQQSFFTFCLRLQVRGVSYLLALALCLLLTGCVVSVPMTKRVQGASGTPEKKTVDLAFIKIGQTQREEVMQKLGWSDTGVKESKLFLGRWISSGSAPLFEIGGYGGGVDDVGRKWNAHNLFVEFDDKGVVSAVHDISEKDLVPQMSDWITRSKAASLQLSPPLELQIEHHQNNGGPDSAQLLLSQSVFEFHESGNKHNFRVTPENILSLTAARPFGKQPNPSDLDESIRFRETTAAGDRISFSISPQGLLVLTKYLHQVQPSALK
jgi:hypothetical protein